MNPLYRKSKQTFTFNHFRDHWFFDYRIYSNTIRILFEPAPPIEPELVLSKFPIIPTAKRAFLEIEPADCNRINTVYTMMKTQSKFSRHMYKY